MSGSGAEITEDSNSLMTFSIASWGRRKFMSGSSSSGKRSA
jgi:hypothetical protein